MQAQPHQPCFYDKFCAPFRVSVVPMAYHLIPSLMQCNDHHIVSMTYHLMQVQGLQARIVRELCRFGHGGFPGLQHIRGNCACVCGIWPRRVVVLYMCGIDADAIPNWGSDSTWMVGIFCVMLVYQQRHVGRRNQPRPVCRAPSL